jgi:hypothetical protein
MAALVILLGGVPRAAEASLIGDSVTCSSATDSFECTPSPTATVGAGSEFVLTIFFTPQFSIDLAASSITLTFLPQAADSFGGEFPATFGDLDSSAGDIVGVGLVTSGACVTSSTHRKPARFPGAFSPSGTGGS